MSFIPLANPLPTTDIIASVGDVIDTSNSSTALLLSGATFTGAWVNVLNYAQVAVVVISDQSSATNGLKIQFSSDGTNVDHTHSYSYAAAFGHAIQAHTHARYYRVTYTNGTTAQATFRLQSILRPVAGSGSIIEVGDIPTGADDAVLTKSVLVGQTVGTSTYSNVKTNVDGSILINQNTQVDATNSTTANLAQGATFTGASVSDLNLTTVQFALYADQNCIVHIDQSIDGVNWDISDSYNYYSALGGSGQSAQLVASYYRMRVTNVGTGPTTILRFQTIQVPFLNPLPRSLDQNGNLQTGVRSIEDTSGFKLRYAPRGETLVVTPYKLVGQAFTDVSLDTNFWTSTPVGSGTAVETGGLLTLATGTTADSTVAVQSNTVARFVGGTANRFRTILRVPDLGTANNTRRWGPFTTTDGAFIQLSGTTFSLVTRKGGVDTVVNNGSFNGHFGSTWNINTNFHTYEIIINVQSVYFFIDGDLYHTVTIPTTPWTSTLHLPIRYENNNSGGSVSNVSMETKAVSIARYGAANSAPVSRYSTGTTAGLNLKAGPGNIHSIIVSGVGNNSVVTLYDNTAATGTILWSSGTMGASTVPFALDLKGVSFSIGLTLVVATASTNVTVIYE